MDFLQSIWQWFYKNIFCDAAIFMAMVCMIGQLAAKIPFFDSLVGGIKCFIGYTVFTSATGALISNFRPLMNEMRLLFDVNVVINESYYGQAAMTAMFQDMGGNTAYQGLVMALGFGGLIVFALLKKITKIRQLNIQGHGLTTKSTQMMCIVYCMYPNLADWQYVLMATLLFICLKTVKSNFTVEPCQDLTDGIGMCIDHTQCYLATIWWNIGKKIEKKSIEKTGKLPTKFDDLVLPGWMNVFTDVYVSSFFAMLVFFGVILALIGKDNLIADGFLKEGASFVMYVVKTAFIFPCQLVILFTGMRMFVAEIMTGFDGLSKSILRGTIPAIDVAAFYGFAGNGTAITMGFFCGTVTMMACTIVQVLIGSPIVVLMGFTQMMFDNASVGIFGHHRGGIKGCLLGSATCGFVDVMLGAVVSYITGFYTYGGIASQSDNCLVWSVLGWLWKLGPAGMFVYFAIELSIPQIYYYFFVKDKKAYWLVAEDYEAYKEYMAEKGTPVGIPVLED